MRPFLLFSSMPEQNANKLDGNNAPVRHDALIRGLYLCKYDRLVQLQLCGRHLLSTLLQRSNKAHTSRVHLSRHTLSNSLSGLFHLFQAENQGGSTYVIVDRSPLFLFVLFSNIYKYVPFSSSNHLSSSSFFCIFIKEE